MQNARNLAFDFEESASVVQSKPSKLIGELSAFKDFGKATIQKGTFFEIDGGVVATPTFINEFWTAKQRAANRLHEISYRACFKPQLPRFFINRLTEPGDRVYDPFMGRGTTLLETALLGRVPVGCDINPLSIAMVKPRLNPPLLSEVEARLNEINFTQPGEYREDLLSFYHPETLKDISALRRYLMMRRKEGTIDAVDEWIAMVGLNRLTGHSPGFFSVYTLPPNQAVSVKSQIKINEKREQTPPQRDVKAIILKKTKSLLSELDEETREQLRTTFANSVLVTASAGDTPQIESDSISLVVTSPPFLNIVQYATDNWLRCWFLGIDVDSVNITMATKLDTWCKVMTKVFHELHRVLKPGGHIAFEVGEVHKGKTRLEETVLQCGVAAKLKPELVMVNDQKFTKTANCWGIDNNFKGTNTNRIVLFKKEIQE